MGGTGICCFRADVVMKKFGFATRLRVIDADSIFFPFAASVVETSRRPAFGLRATVTLAVGKEGDKVTGW